jgi:hypothetical protein
MAMATRLVANRRQTKASDTLRVATKHVKHGGKHSGKHSASGIAMPTVPPLTNEQMAEIVSDFFVYLDNKKPKTGLRGFVGAIAPLFVSSEPNPLIKIQNIDHLEQLLRISGTVPKAQPERELDAVVLKQALERQLANVNDMVRVASEAVEQQMEEATAALASDDTSAAKVSAEKATSTAANIWATFGSAATSVCVAAQQAYAKAGAIIIGAAALTPNFSSIALTKLARSSTDRDPTISRIFSASLLRLISDI